MTLLMSIHDFVRLASITAFTYKLKFSESCISAIYGIAHIKASPNTIDTLCAIMKGLVKFEYGKSD